MLCAFTRKILFKLILLLLKDVCLSGFRFLKIEGRIRLVVSGHIKIPDTHIQWRKGDLSRDELLQPHKCLLRWACACLLEQLNVQNHTGKHFTDALFKWIQLLNPVKFKKSRFSLSGMYLTHILFIEFNHMASF